MVSIDFMAKRGGKTNLNSIFTGQASDGDIREQAQQMVQPISVSCPIINHPTVYVDILYHPCK